MEDIMNGVSSHCRILCDDVAVREASVKLVTIKKAIHNCLCCWFGWRLSNGTVPQYYISIR